MCLSITAKSFQYDAICIDNQATFLEVNSDFSSASLTCDKTTIPAHALQLKDFTEEQLQVLANSQWC